MTQTQTHPQATTRSEAMCAHRATTAVVEEYRRKTFETAIKTQIAAIQRVDNIMEQRRRKGRYYAEYLLQSSYPTALMLKQAALMICWHYSRIGMDYATTMKSDKGNWTITVSWEAPKDFNTITLLKSEKTVRTTDYAHSDTPPKEVWRLFELD